MTVHKPVSAVTGALAATLLAAALVAAPARASDLIKVIVPFSAGGPTDQIARIIAPSLGEQLGKKIIIENRGGAGGTIGAAVVAKAAPDGETLLLSTSSLILSAGTRANLSFDARKDLDPVYLLGEVQTMIAVRPSLGADTLAQLVEKAKGSKKLTYGSTGVGGTMHIGGELFSRAAAAELVHVPYGGAAPAIIDLIAGNIDFVNADVPVLQPYIKEGRLKGLVIFDKTRSTLLPDIPTAAQAGMPDLQMTNWYGVLAPVGTPPAVKARLQEALAKVLREPEIAAKLAASGFTNPQGAAQFKARYDADYERWIPWLKAANIQSK